MIFDVVPLRTLMSQASIWSDHTSPAPRPWRAKACHFILSFDLQISYLRSAYSIDSTFRLVIRFYSDRYLLHATSRVILLDLIKRIHTTARPHDRTSKRPNESRLTNHDLRS